MRNKFYANPSGLNTNNGLSEQFAFQDIAAAVAAAVAADGGQIFVGRTASQPTWASQVSGGGIWLRGPYDVGDGGPGWVDTNNKPISIYFEHSQGQQFGFGGSVFAPGAGATAFTDSPFQLCGSQIMVTMENGIVGATPPTLPTLPFPAMRIGWSSLLTAWESSVTYAHGKFVTYSGGVYASQVDGNVGHQPNSSPIQWAQLAVPAGTNRGTSLTANFTFRANEIGSISTFPAVDIGYAFLGRWDDNQFDRADAPDPTDSAAAAVRLWCAQTGGNIASYLQTFNGNTLNGGGFWSVGGNSQLVFDNTFGENMATPALTCEYAGTTRGATSCVVTNMDIGDSDIAIPALRTKRNRGGMVVVNGHIGPCDGPFFAGVTDNVANAVGGLAKGQYGSIGGITINQQDSHRRNSPIFTTPATNWCYPPYAFNGTNVDGPFGLPNSARRGIATRTITNDGLGYTLAAGDRLFWGLFVRFVDGAPTDSGTIVANSGSTGTVTVTFGGPGPMCGETVTLGPSEGFSWAPANPISQGQWGYWHGWLKFVSKTGDGTLTIRALPGALVTTDAAYTIAGVVPASDPRSDDEVACLAMHSTGENYYAGGTLHPPTPGMATFRRGAEIEMLDETLGKYVKAKLDNGAWVITVPP